MIYLNHRAFLPNIDMLRSQRKNFPSEMVPPCQPALKTMAFVDASNAKLLAETTAKGRAKVTKASGCKGAYSLRRLPSHDRLHNTPVDAMHLIKNIAEHIVKLLSTKTDTESVRNEEKSRKRFKNTWVVTESQAKGKEKYTLPPAPFSLCKHDLTIANKRAMSIKSPLGFDWNPCQLFGKLSSKLNSNQWKHVLSSGILKFCIRGLLGDDQRATLNELCDIVSLLVAEEIDMSTMESVEYRVHRVLSLLERDFPVSLHVISFHLLHHLPMFVQQFGPTHSFWMYPMERFNSWISRRVLNRRYPESTVMETYRLYEWTYFLEIAGEIPHGATVDIAEVNSLDSSHSNSANSVDIEPVLACELQAFYAMTNPDYKNLLKRYDQEKAESQMADFPSLELWIPEEGQPLTESQLTMRNGLSPTMTRFKTFVYTDKFHRKIKYGSVLSERVNSASVSSYIHLLPTNSFDSPVQFGRIQFIFKHTFNDRVHTLVKVRWFNGFVKHIESGLAFIDLNSNSLLSPIVCLDEVSRPLIHAVDDSDPKKLWILNFIP